MKNEVINNEFEVSLRMILLLSVSKRSMSLDRATVCDFASIYSKSFGLGDMNLNGESLYTFSEFAAKRSLVNKALHSLVISGFAIAESTPKGFVFSLSASGVNASCKMIDDYSKEYRRFARLSVNVLGGKPEYQILDMFNLLAAESIGRI